MKGNELERILKMLGRELADHQVCKFFKVPEEFQQTPCDFFGYTRAGQAILIEAKEVNRERLPIGTSNGLKIHQYNELEAAHKAGAISIVCWAVGELVAAIPFEWIMQRPAGTKSINWKHVPLDWKADFTERARFSWLNRFFPITTLHHQADQTNAV